MSHHIVEVHQLQFAYPDGTAALRDISFQIRHGEAVAIIGANGAGKSTLLLHLVGCLTAAGGTIRIGDHLLGKESLAEVRRTVGMVFQEPDDQLFMPTVADDVAFGPRNQGADGASVAARVSDALHRVGAWPLRDKPPYHLSAGEKKRVAIATVLAMLPEILVLDEPSSGLDPRARRQLIALLRGFHHTRIIATHDLDLVLELCERTIVLHRGTLMADAPTRDIFRNEELLAACHLEQPFAMQGCPACSPRGPAAGIETPPSLVAPHGDAPHEHSRPSFSAK